MSSPKAAAKIATKPARRSATSAELKAVATRTVAPKPKTPQTGLSADAIKLAGDIEQAFKKSDDAISEDAMQTLMAALCRIYAAQVENGAFTAPFNAQSAGPPPWNLYRLDCQIAHVVTVEEPYCATLWRF